ncbi:MAG: hypothetical protein WA821_02780 [Anaerolineales bacterium]
MSKVQKSNDAEQKDKDIKDLTDQLEKMQAINFTWYQAPENAPAYWLLLKILGILITAFAVSQGSSFWYDLIKKMKGDATPTDTTTNVVATSADGTKNMMWRSETKK